MKAGTAVALEGTYEPSPWQPVADQVRLFEETDGREGAELEGKPVVTKVNGKPATSPEYVGRFGISPRGKVVEYGEIDVLYLNDGHGHFTPLSFTNENYFLDEDGLALAEPPRDWGLAVQFYDLNGDGAPDIYVCNDLFTPDRIWMNDGKGKFRLRPLPAEAQFAPIRAVLADDFDGDGKTDLLVAGNFFGVPPMLGRYDAGYGLLLRGDGRGSFAAVDLEADNLVIEGQARHLGLLRRANGDRLIVVARNNDRVQVLRPGVQPR